MFYPVNLNLKDKECVVVGAGEVAFRKVKMLLKCNAKVKVVSPKFSDKFKRIKNKDISLIKRKFQKNDLKNAFVVIGATDDAKLNEKISELCDRRNLLVNIVDAPEFCNFIVPSVVKRGPLTISISTSGVSPLIAKVIRMELEKKYDSNYVKFLDKVGKIRKLVLKQSPEYKTKVFNKIEGIALSRKGKIKKINKLLQKINGK